MIRILNKPALPPGITFRSGPNKGKHKFEVATEKVKVEYDEGKRAFTFQSKIYGHRKVKRALIAAQFGKCCFCEAAFTANAYGDVEHFRPKGGFKQDKSDNELQVPGYYWLAYDWDNLLFSCQICNQSYKQNHFPLTNPSQRARNHYHNIEEENPLLIHPVHEDPEQHITFSKEIPLGLTERGRKCISLLGLDRESLSEDRRKLLEIIEAMEIALIDQGVSTQTKEKISRSLKKLISPQKPFYSMLKSNFGHIIPTL